MTTKHITVPVRLTEKVCDVIISNKGSVISIIDPLGGSGNGSDLVREIWYISNNLINPGYILATLGYDRNSQGRYEFPKELFKASL